MKSGIRWIVDKRFSEFRNLRNELNMTRPGLREEIYFPRKKWKLFFNLQESFLNERRDQLCSYIQSLIILDVVPPELDPFLNIKDYIWEFTQGGPALQAKKLRSPDGSSTAGASFVSDTVTVNDFQLLKVCQYIHMLLHTYAYTCIYSCRCLGKAALVQYLWCVCWVCHILHRRFIQ